MMMKRKTNTLLIALVMAMCLFLLSACGADKTEETTAPESASESTKQQSADVQEEQAEQEEPEQEEPEEAEEPEPEEVEEQNNAGTEFLALLQEEYENGFVVGKGAKHTFYHIGVGEYAYIDNDVVYIMDNIVNNDGFGVTSCDIATKALKLCDDFKVSDRDVWNYLQYGLNWIDGTLYSPVGLSVKFTSAAGERFNFEPSTFFDKGIFGLSDSGYAVLSYDIEKIADIALPQYEAEHGLKEDMKLEKVYAADGTVYAIFSEADTWYRLNTDTYEWEDTGDTIPDITTTLRTQFLGKYWASNDGMIYNIITGEQVFEYGELYAPPCNDYSVYINNFYFGSDKYLGCKNGEYRWVNLTNLSMSEPLLFPEGKDVVILDDTYCVYNDKYGWFLWNYTDGTEETIKMFDN